MTLFALAAGVQGADVGSNLFFALMLQVHSGIPGVQRQGGNRRRKNLSVPAVHRAKQGFECFYFEYEY